MRIAFIVGVYPPEPEPTAQMASELVQQWSNDGHSVTVICPFPNRPSGTIYRGFTRLPYEVSNSPNLRIIRVWTWLIGRKRRHLNRLLENLSFGIASSLAILFAAKPDIVILETWPIVAQLTVLGVSKIRKLRVLNYVKDLYPEAVNTTHLLKHTGPLGQLLLRADRTICGTACCNIVISEKMKTLLVSTRGCRTEEVHVIHDWINLDVIRPFERPNGWRAEVGIPADEIVFMFAGTMGFASGVDVLLDVAEMLRNTSGIRIVCIGEGLLKETLVRGQMLRKLSNLTILGFQARERISEIQSSADAMLLITSLKMGSSSVPSKLITYFAVGKPVLCSVSDDSDIANLVRSNDIGIVVPPGDVSGISGGIVQLASMGRAELTRKGVKARELAVQAYSLPRALSDFKRVFKTVIGNN